MHSSYSAEFLKSLSTQNLCQRQLIIHEVCVLDLNRTISAWRRGEASSAILAKSLSDCVTVLCLGQCKSRYLKVCEIMKRTCYFQTNGISYILNWDVICLCHRWRWFHVLFWASSSNCPTPPPTPHLIWEPPLLCKLKSAFANKNSSLIQIKMLVSYLWKSMHQRLLFLFCE